MEDIIPFGEKKKTEIKSRRENVLRIEYKLPARLRKPIGKKISQSTRAGVKKTDGVTFERRSIMSELPSRVPPSYKKNTGVEQHTGDVYMKARPDVRIVSPPYMGQRVVNGMRSKQTQLGQERQRLIGKQADSMKRKSHKLRAVVLRPKKRVENKAAAIMDQGVRDVPYQFGGKGGASKAQAQTMGLYSETKKKEQLEEDSVLEIFQPSSGIISTTKGFKDFASSLTELFKISKGKQVAFNIGVLLVGCVVLYGVVWNLSGLGKGLQVMGGVQERVAGAYHRLISASAAMAENDFASSESDFSSAAELISDAKGKLDKAMSASQSVLRYVDLTGTVRSGQEMLNAGEKLSEAGVYIARGVDLLLSNFGDKSFVEAVSSASEDFMMAVSYLDEVEKSLNKVETGLLPEEIQSEVATLKSIVPIIRAALGSFTDRSDVLLALLGATRDQQYLLLFQNNHEIRPTGGFIGSIGLVNIDRGTVEEIDIASVYDSDGQMRDYIAPPEPLRAVTNRWYMRDANWFIDFPTSARKVMEFFEKEGGPTVDGVIALTPEVIRELLRITGPINVPAYGVEVSYDNFWRVTQDQVSYSYDKELNRPKQFLVDLAPLLLNKLFEAEAASSVEALGGLIAMIEQKHLMVYLHNEELQNKLNDVGWSGELPREKKGLLAVNNSNIAGHKSDQFIEQEIDYRLEMMPDGSVEGVVMIRREHRGDIERSDYTYPEDEDPSTKDNVVYQRVLVPNGSKLLEAGGFSTKTQVPQMVVYEDFDDLKADDDLVEWQTGQYEHESGTVIGQEAGYTFFSNWLVTKPGQTSMAFYRYRLPNIYKLPNIIDPAKRLEAYIVKQPGDNRTKIRVEIKLPEEMGIIHTAPSTGITQDSNSSLVYRSELKKDMLVGAVFERR